MKIKDNKITLVEMVANPDKVNKNTAIITAIKYSKDTDTDITLIYGNKKARITSDTSVTSVSNMWNKKDQVRDLLIYGCIILSLIVSYFDVTQ